jgi:dihydrofolate synthase/folylpolyglutamate synthase
VITNIGLDHTGVLGNTVEAIAAEKAAVIKPGCKVVLYRQSQSVMDVVAQICAEQGASLQIAGVEDLEVLSDTLEGQRIRRKGLELTLPLLGEHQRHNAAVALAVAEALGLAEQAIADGMAAARWPGRFEVLSHEPWFIVDGGHNPQCAETVAHNLKYYFPGKPAVILIGVLADKDYSEVCSIVEPCAGQFVTVTPGSYRALSAEALAEQLSRYGKSVTACSSVAEGVAKACELAGPDGMVCAFGSLYMTGDIRACFGLG